MHDLTSNSHLLAMIRTHNFWFWCFLGRLSLASSVRILWIFENPVSHENHDDDDKQTRTQNSLNPWRRFMKQNLNFIEIFFIANGCYIFSGVMGECWKSKATSWPNVIKLFRWEIVKVYIYRLNDKWMVLLVLWTILTTLRVIERVFLEFDEF